MSDITASMVKELRGKTGAGMMDCKNALMEVGGDLEAAIDWLRKSGLAAAEKKSGRTAAEGLVTVLTNGAQGAIVEINAETDFVARNQHFQEFSASIAKICLEIGGDIDSLKSSPFADGKTVEEALTNLVATIGENMALRRADCLTVPDGIVSSYVHNSVVPGSGKIGVLLGLQSTGDLSKLKGLGKQIAMHVAAAAPLYCRVDDVDPHALRREKEVLTEQARQSGKPDNIVKKMVEGRLQKFFEEVVLEEQLYVIDGENKVKKVLEKSEEEVGAPIKITGFVRYVLGDGIERKEEDFASEVAATARG